MCIRDRYHTGDTAIIKVTDISTDETIEVPVNFTEVQKPTFSTWEQAAQYINFIDRSNGDNSDVFVDSSLSVDTHLSQNTIDAFDQKRNDRMNTSDFSADQYPQSLNSENNFLTGRVDNAERFYKLSLKNESWTTDISSSDISSNWDKNDIISVNTVFNSEYDSTNGILTLFCDKNLFSEGETIIVLAVSYTHLTLPTILSV